MEDSSPNILCSQYWRVLSSPPCQPLVSWTTRQKTTLINFGFPRWAKQQALLHCDVSYELLKFGLSSNIIECQGTCHFKMRTEGFHELILCSYLKIKVSYLDLWCSRTRTTWETMSGCGSISPLISGSTLSSSQATMSSIRRLWNW